MDPGLNAPTLDTYKRLFTEGRDLTSTARERAKKHRRYYDGKVDDRTERKIRGKNKPTFNINRVRPGVEGMVGVVDRGKSDPRAYPRTPQDEASSEVATDALRYVSDINRWHQIKIAGFRNMLIEGVAAVLTEVDANMEVRFRRIRFEEYFYDPYSRELDFGDKSYDGIAKWTYVDAVIAQYPEHEAALRLAVSSGDTGDATWDDRPENGAVSWTDSQRKRLLLVEMYYLHGGQWLKCVFVGDLKLEEGVSPYEDQEGKPCNPIEAISAYLDDENNRYGVVSDMVGPQDEINTYRRNAAHFATFRQFQETGDASAHADPEEVRREGAKPDGVIPAGYGIVPNDKFAMNMTFAQEAKGEIERASVNPAILGRQGESQSGRAALVRQQAGLTELSHLFGGLDDWELRIMRQAWARIRQFWTEAKFIRVTDDENAVRFIQINEPIMGPPMPVTDPATGFLKIDPITRQIEMRPQVIGMRNAVAQMGVDIIVDTTPDTANVQQEQFQALVDMVPALIQAGIRPPIKSIIRNSSLPKKSELIEEIEAGSQEQQPDPMAQQAAELAARKAASDIDKTDAQAEQARATAVKTVGEARANEMQTRFLTQQPGF